MRALPQLLFVLLQLVLALLQLVLALLQLVLALLQLVLALLQLVLADCHLEGALACRMICRTWPTWSIRCRTSRTASDLGSRGRRRPLLQLMQLLLLQQILVDYQLGE